MKALGLILALVLGALAAAATPVEAQGVEAGGGIVLVPVRPAQGLRPMPRPADLRRSAPPRVAVREVASGLSVTRSPRPQPRPENLQRRATVAGSGMVPVPVPVMAPARGGRVCNSRTIQGERIQNIPGRLRGCGLSQGVAVTAVAGVALSRPARIDCDTARALETWVERGVKPIIGRLGGGVARLEIAASYACRTRNSMPGARISEHGRGRAVDVAGVTLANGTTLSVLRGWRDPQIGPLMRQMHQAACGPFGTVLGPASDRFHQDHFHFDTARYRSGPFCR